MLREVPDYSHLKVPKNFTLPKFHWAPKDEPYKDGCPNPECENFCDNGRQYCMDNPDGNDCANNSFKHMHCVARVMMLSCCCPGPHCPKKELAKGKE